MVKGYTYFCNTTGSSKTPGPSGNSGRNNIPGVVSRCPPEIHRFVDLNIMLCHRPCRPIRAPQPTRPPGKALGGRTPTEPSTIGCCRTIRGHVFVSPFPSVLFVDACDSGQPINRLRQSATPVQPIPPEPGPNCQSAGRPGLNANLPAIPVPTVCWDL